MPVCRKELRPADLNLIYLADKYRLTAGTIIDCVEEYQDRLLMKGAQPNMADLLAACTDQLEHRLGRDAVRIEAKYRWEDLILPEPQKKLLADACDQVLLHHQVYHRWGFDKKLAYGKGVSMIFYGPPGTGKTMGALKKNVIRPMLQIMEAWGWPYEYIRSGTDARIEIGSNSYYLYGANTEAAQDALQGLTAAGAYLDEAALFPKSFVDQAVARCSVDGWKILDEL